MKFSIIIPVFNAEKYIFDSVNSVLNQTYKNFEIVLIDDGSSDGSAKICDALADKYNNIIKVVHQENKGQLLSRCTGAEVAQGDYCVYLDADDLLYANCLERLFEAINTFSSPDIVIYNFERLALSGEKICKPIPLESNFVYRGEQKKQIYNVLLSGSTLNNIWNKCVRRECLVGCSEQFSDYQSLRCGEDRLQVLESVTKAESIVYIDDVLYCYRLFDGSVTRNFDVSNISKFNMILLCEAEETYLKKWEISTIEFQKKLEAIYLNNVIYTFLIFYDNSKKYCVKKEIIKYNWLSFVPNKYLENVRDNNNLSEFNKKMWGFIKHKKYFNIKYVLWKRDIYKTIKAIKRKFL